MNNNEIAILLAVLNNANNCTSGIIRNYLKNKVHLSLTLPILFTTLDRLEKQGYLKINHYSDKQYRNKKYYSVTQIGYNQISGFLWIVKTLLNDGQCQHVSQLKTLAEYNLNHLDVKCVG